MSNEEMVEHLRNRWLEPDPEKKPKYICERCLCEIRDGERKWDINGSILCDDCAKDQYSEEVDI